MALFLADTSFNCDCMKFDVGPDFSDVFYLSSGCSWSEARTLENSFIHLRKVAVISELLSRSGEVFSTDTSGNAETLGRHGVKKEAPIWTPR